MWRNKKNNAHHNLQQPKLLNININTNSCVVHGPVTNYLFPCWVSNHILFCFYLFSLFNIDLKCNQ